VGSWFCSSCARRLKKVVLRSVPEELLEVAVPVDELVAAVLAFVLAGFASPPLPIGLTVLRTVGKV
jgi:hypothetical protein